MDRPLSLSTHPRGAGAAARMLFQVVSAAIGFAAIWLGIGAMTLYLAFIASLVGGLVVYLVRVFGERPAPWAAAPLSGVLTVSWLGLALAFDLGGAIWVGALVLTLPPVMSLWWRRPGAGGSGADREDLAALDVDVLCRLWRHSYVRLERSGPGPHHAAMVEFRQLVLDELTTRDPDGISRWLASNPRAAGNPMPFLSERGRQPG